jgi:hypothetical protein
MTLGGCRTARFVVHHRGRAVRGSPTPHIGLTAGLQNGPIDEPSDNSDEVRRPAPSAVSSPLPREMLRELSCHHRDLLPQHFVGERVRERGGSVFPERFEKNTGGLGLVIPHKSR